jgi:hypothetical protein
VGLSIGEDMISQQPEGAEQQKEYMRRMMMSEKCSSCPECGSIEVNEGSEDFYSLNSRVCAKCGQEWFTDIDYPHHKDKLLESDNE